MYTQASRQKNIVLHHLYIHIYVYDQKMNGKKYDCKNVMSDWQRDKIIINISAGATETSATMKMEKHAKHERMREW